MLKWHTVRITSRLDFMGEVEARILSDLKDKGLDRKEIFALRLALEEAVANAIKHGNAMDESKHVTVRYLIEPERISMEISDDGPGFDFNHVPDPTSPDRLELPHGRGIMLMRAYMDDVAYTDNGSTVRLLLKRGPRATEPKGSCCDGDARN